MAPEEDFITSVFSYKDPRVKRLVWMLKFKNKKPVAAIVGPRMAAALAELVGEEKFFLGSGPIILVPIPLSKKRRAARGYNQAEEIARQMLKHLPGGAFVLDTRLLRKKRETKAQADIKARSARLSNLGDCFEAASDRLSKSAPLVLVDDVTTTGATLLAARKALRAAGFKNIRAVTAAH